MDEAERCFLDRYFKKERKREVNGGASIVVHADLERVSKEAYFVNVKGVKFWLPKSQVVLRGGLLVAPAWLIKGKGVKVGR